MQNSSTLQKIKRHLPETIKKTVKQALTAFKKPELSYLELHLTDHCNLDCKGCGHFCPIALPQYANLDQHEKDMRRLSNLFSNVRTIRLLGGEPLLHPEAASFIAVTRKLFPCADIRIATNGILLTSVTDTFWTTCRDTCTTIDLTVYPPLRSRVGEWQLLCESRGVSLNTIKVERFNAQMNLKGDSDKDETFFACRSHFYCPFLRNGRIYSCAISAQVHYFNDRFNRSVTSGKGLDIHTYFISGHKILRVLDRPISSCKYCSPDVVSFAWSKSNQTSEEWDVDAQRNLQDKRLKCVNLG